MTQTITYNQKIVQIISWIEWSPDGLSFIGMNTVKTYDLENNLIYQVTKESGIKGKYE